MLFWPVLLPASWVLMGHAYSGNDPQALDAFAERAGSTNVAGFVFVGYAMSMWLSSLLWGSGTALRQEQVRGSLEAVFVTPASRLVPLFGPGVATLIPMAATFVVMGLPLWLFFGVVPPLGAGLAAPGGGLLRVPGLFGSGAPFPPGGVRFGGGRP